MLNQFINLNSLLLLWIINSLLRIEIGNRKVFLLILIKPVIWMITKVNLLCTLLYMFCPIKVVFNIPLNKSLVIFLVSLSFSLPLASFRISCCFWNTHSYLVLLNWVTSHSSFHQVCNIWWNKWFVLGLWSFCKQMTIIALCSVLLLYNFVHVLFLIILLTKCLFIHHVILNLSFMLSKVIIMWDVGRIISSFVLIDSSFS